MTNREYIRFFSKVFSILGISGHSKFDYYVPVRSLMDLSKNLAYYNIKHFVAQFNIEKIEKLIFPIITETKDGKLNVICAEKHGKLLLYCPYESQSYFLDKKKIRDNFKNHFLLVEKVPGFHKTITKKKSFVNNSVLIFALLLLVLAISFFSPPFWVILTNLIGLILVSFLIKLEQDIFDPRLEKLCSNQIDCSTQKSSIISLSFPGAVYFLFNTLLVLGISFFNLKLIIFLHIVTLAGVILSLFLITYQYFFSNSICKICLVISLIIFLNYALLNVLIPWTYQDLSSIDLFYVLFVLGLAIGILGTLKDRIYFNKKVKSFTWDRNIILTNKSVLESLLVKNSKVEYKSQKLLPSLGNSSGSKNLSLVIDINCKHCFMALFHLGNLTQLNSDYLLSIAIRFDRNEYNDNMFIRFAEACYDNDFLRSFEILESWKIHRIINKSLSDNTRDTPITANSIFFQEYEIKYFPYILIEDKELPHLISTEQIKVAYGGI